MNRHTIVHASEDMLGQGCTVSADRMFAHMVQFVRFSPKLGESKIANKSA